MRSILQSIFSSFTRRQAIALPPHTMREYLIRLEQAGELQVIDAPVSPYLEIAEISRRTVLEEGKALLFTQVEGSPFPVATNLYGSQKRLRIAFGEDVEDRIHSLANLLTRDFPPSLNLLWKKKKELLSLTSLRTKRVKWTSSPIAQQSIFPPDLTQIPLLTSWKEDGGAFITLPLVYTESVETGKASKNLGMYRIQRFDQATTGLHFQIGKGGGFHLHAAEQAGKNLPVAIFMGGPPALTLSAIAPLPENVPEFLFASFLLRRPLPLTYSPYHPYPIPSEADFALLGYAKHGERRLEGPFGDHFGYLSLAHEFPVFHCSHIMHRKDAVFPATVVGPPPQEDMYIGEFLQKAMSPLFPIIMPTIQSLHTYSESGFHPLAVAKVKERYEKESLSSALRILGEGQLALTKILFVIDDLDINLPSFRDVFSSLLAKIRPEEDIIILSHTANDTLDYTGEKLNRGSKAIFIGTGTRKHRKLPTEPPRNLPNYIQRASLFCPGCLVIECEEEVPLQSLAEDDWSEKWPCIIVVDDVQSCVSSQMQFLWQVFTRFDPAQDIYFRSQKLRKNSVGFSFPMVIDARMKESYPPVLSVDESTKRLVDSRWKEYFSR